MGRDTSRPELGPNPVGPWPDMVGVIQCGNLGHEPKHRKHKDIEKLTAISPSAKTGSKGGRSVPAIENGGRRSL